MVTKLLTTIDDLEILNGQIDTFTDVSGTGDRYLITAATDGDVNVSDFDGGVIVLQAGVTLDSVQVAAGGAEVILGINGSTYSFEAGDADATFSLVLGGSNENLAAGETVTADELVDLFEAAGAGAVVGADGSLGDGSVDPGPGPSDDLELTTQRDVLTGTAGDDVFTAPVVQNQTGSGQLANTFETGDVLNGGGGVNVLEATLISSGAIGLGGFQGPSISATTTNIDQVYLRGQNLNGIDFASNPTAGSNVDAELMLGVEQWWSDNSRANIQIEDIRSRPNDTTFGMRLTDPQVSFLNYFNPLVIQGDINRESALTLIIAELTAGDPDEGLQLTNFRVESVNFGIGGQEVSLSSQAISDAATWDALAVALNDALAAEGLEEVSAVHVGQGTFVLDDPEGREFTSLDGEEFVETVLQPNVTVIDTRIAGFQGAVETEEPAETDIVLDGAGNGSQGGTLDIGVVSGLRGIEIFNIQVDNDSHLVRVESTSAREGNLFLEEVNIVNQAGGAMGDLQVGIRTIEAGVSNTTDDRLDATDPATAGFQNVRSVDASGFAGMLALSATIGEESNFGPLTDDVFDRYLDDAEEVVTFEYLLGDGGSNLSLFVNDLVSQDLDFALNIEGGAMDDRINLENLTTKDSTTVDGGMGFNTIEVNQSTQLGTTAFGEFVNFDKLVVAGLGSTQDIVDGNMTDIDGDEVVIATQEGAASVNVNQLRTDTELTVSGKNQTIGAGEGNDDQNFATVGVNYSRGVPDIDRVEITLENTARLDGELDLAGLNVSTTGTAGVNELDLNSEGERDTNNLVRTSSFVGINIINLLGTQDLAINVNAMPAGPSIVDGSELEGDLLLGMNAGLLNGTNNVITGTDGMSDLFAVYSEGATSNVTATVSGFEQIQLGLTGGQFDFTLDTIPDGEFRGVYNAGNTTGAGLYFIQNTANEAVSVVNLGISENVLVATELNGDEVGLMNDDQADLTFAAAARDTGNTISIELANDGMDYDGAWANGDRELTIIDYRTVNLQLDTGDAEFVLTLNEAMEDTYTRTLDISGGDADHSSATTSPDQASLDIGQLDTALTLVDISDYDGELVDAQWDSQLGSNAVVVGNEFNFNFDLLDNATFGQALSIFNGQLGMDADYAGNMTFDISVNIDGTPVALPAPLVQATQAGMKNASLADLATAVSALAPTAVTVGGSDYEIDYTGSFVGGNLNVSVVVTDVTDPANEFVVGPDVAFVDAVSLDVNAGTIALDQTDILSGFITTFDFDTDAESFGVVWEVADFNAFNVDGVSLSNVSILDLSDLGVAGLADIVVQDGADYRAGLTPEEAQAYLDFDNNAMDFDGMPGMPSTVITSNGDLDFTIHLTGVDFLDMSNENFVFAV